MPPSNTSDSVSVRAAVGASVLSAAVASFLTYLWTVRCSRRRVSNRGGASSVQLSTEKINGGLSAQEFNDAAHSLIDELSEYRATVAQRPVKSIVEPGYLRKLVPGDAPENSESWSDIQKDIERVIMPGITHWASPNFYAYFPAFGGFPSLLGEMVCSTLNTIGFSWIGSPASTELELLCCDWIAKMAQLPAAFLHESNGAGGGTFQGTAAEAGAVALLAGKAKALEGLSAEEADAESQKLTAYISDQTHGIIAKGCKITGIPLTRLRTIKTTAETNFGMTLASVKESMEADAAKGFVPAFICLTIGSTSSTARDDIEGIAAYVNKKFPKCFIHIDAAYAGSFAMLPHLRHLFNGVELVDSFSFNPHKSLLIAFDTSLLYVRSRRPLLAALSLANDGEYLRNAATESGRVIDLKDWQLPFGRRFRSLKLWFTLRTFGQKGIRAHLQSAIDNAQRFKNHIRESARFQLQQEPTHFGLVCFDLVFPQGVQLDQQAKNAANEALKEHANSTGEIFFISTMLAGRTVLRLACNGASQHSFKDIDRAWKVIEQAADHIWKQKGWALPASSSSSASSSSTSSAVVPASSISATVPVINIAALLDAKASEAAKEAVTQQIYNACTTWGFFYIQGHGISEQLQDRMEALSKQFFALSHEEKMKITMKKGGVAWRGFFPVGDELTSGKPDIKEGLYFGTELSDSHPMVKAGTPLHGKNQFPDDSIPELRTVVLEYINRVTALAHILMRGIGQSLKLKDKDYFENNLLKDPTVLFRIFNYPEHERHALSSTHKDVWGVGEHTDYGLLTILKQDESGGLQVRMPGDHGRWIEAPPIPGTFVCNIGDMLERLTEGRYKSTPHRVRNKASHDRLSFPFFFDPSWSAEVKPLPLDHLPPATIQDDVKQRWDKASVHTLSGTYGDYLLKKVGKVFPNLKQQVMNDGPRSAY